MFVFVATKVSQNSDISKFILQWERDVITTSLAVDYETIIFALHHKDSKNKIPSKKEGK